MNAFAKLANILAVPLAFTNAFGGIVAGIWLAILSEWTAIAYGIIMLFFAGFALGIAMMPGLLLAAPAAGFYEKGNKAAFYTFAFLSTLYTVAVLTIWCVAVMYVFATRANTSSIIPMLLWSYGVATSPIAWLAQKDLQSGNEFAMISTFFGEVAYLLVVLIVLFAPVSVVDAVVFFGIVMLIGMVIQFRIAFLGEKSGAHLE